MRSIRTPGLKFVTVPENVDYFGVQDLSLLIGPSFLAGGIAVIFPATGLRNEIDSTTDYALIKLNIPVSDPQEVATGKHKAIENPRPLGLFKCGLRECVRPKPSPVIDVLTILPEHAKRSAETIRHSTHFGKFIAVLVDYSHLLIYVVTFRAFGDLRGRMYVVRTLLPACAEAGDNNQDYWLHFFCSPS